MAYSYNGMLQSSEQKWTIATHNNEWIWVNHSDIMIGERNAKKYIQYTFI